MNWIRLKGNELINLENIAHIVVYLNTIEYVSISGNETYIETFDTNEKAEDSFDICCQSMIWRDR